MNDDTHLSTSRLTVAVVYATAMLQGLTMVSFPASSTLLKELKGFTDAQYGLIFIPQLCTAILGSVAGGGLARGVGLKSLLVVALAANALSQLGLASAVELLTPNSAFLTVMASTALFGLAFGLGAAPLNTLPGLLFPRRHDAALVALHTLLGVGLALGPVIVGWLTMENQWYFFPLFLVGCSVLVALAALGAKLPSYAASTEGHEAGVKIEPERPLVSRTLWTFIAIAVLYAFAEGTFSNWSVIYLHEERGIELALATLALSLFWATMAAGRLLVSFLLLKIPAQWIWLVLPLLMVSVFLLLPLAHTALLGIALFALAGLSCSAFFPLSVGLVSKRFPASAALVSSLMIAALMSGVGIGSFMIGPLRSSISLERLYQLSSIYPTTVFMLALLMIRSHFGGIVGATPEST
jgi:fucose permease